MCTNLIYSANSTIQDINKADMDKIASDLNKQTQMEILHFFIFMNGPLEKCHITFLMPLIMFVIKHLQFLEHMTFFQSIS